jgi:anaphase-promoting complex subunit 7
LFRDSGWTHSYAAFAARDYPKAISGFKQLENRPLLRNDIGILVTLGLAQYYGGEYAAAISTLQRVHKLEPNNLKGMDALAALLAKEKRARELESLASRLMSISEEAPEPWVAMGYYCYMVKKLSKAVYFAHKGMRISLSVSCLTLLTSCVDSQPASRVSAV